MIDAAFGDVVAAARAALPHDVVRAQWRAMEEWEAPRRGRAPGRDRRAGAGRDRERGRVVPPANSLALAAGSPAPGWRRFPHSGHGFMADHPDSLARLISTFLAVD